MDSHNNSRSVLFITKNVITFCGELTLCSKIIFAFVAAYNAANFISLPNQLVTLPPRQLLLPDELLLVC